ncbi:TPA: helix-turn-helix transcriptional regulator [Serratia fonticola]|nr:helix-turn-helix transcriptional regulator [Serratia fonticola]
MKEHKTFGDRFLARREELGLTQEEVAEKAGITRMAISKIELGMTKKPRVDNLFALAKALKVNPDWLSSGRGSKEPDVQRRDTGHLRVSHSKNTVLTVPLIQWSELNFTDDELDLPSDEVLLTPCPVPTSQGTFAVSIHSTAMLPRFEPGDTVFINPELIDPEDNKYVLVFDIKNKEFSFKQIQLIDKTAYFKVLNPDYPADLKFIKMTEDHKIIGTAVSHVKPV